MNKIHSIVLPALAITLCCCNKEKKKPFSVWNIDGVEHRSQNISSFIGNAQSFVSCNDYAQQWSIWFYSGRLPTEGDWAIQSFPANGNDPSYAYIRFEKDSTVIYAITEHNSNKLSASEKNYNSVYTLPPTWFWCIKTKFYDSLIHPAVKDSVLISGVFNQAETY